MTWFLKMVKDARQSPIPCLSVIVSVLKPKTDGHPALFAHLLRTLCFARVMLCQIDYGFLQDVRLAP